MQTFAQRLLFATAIIMMAAWVFAQESGNTSTSTTSFPPILFDTDEMPPEFPVVNPYKVGASMNSWTTPILNHEGKPHESDHLIQIIIDGGNGRQDPPRFDGLPGGDDSIAFGNFNLMRMSPPEDCPDGSGRKGMFYSKRYFVPLSPPTRAYYLRLWEGKDATTAPYYQDSIEYNANSDRGGGMIFLRSGEPMDIDWTFGPSKPRPSAEGGKG